MVVTQLPTAPLLLLSERPGRSGAGGDSQVWCVARAAVNALRVHYGNDHAPLGAHGLHPHGQEPFPAPKVVGVS